MLGQINFDATFLGAFSFSKLKPKNMGGSQCIITVVLKKYVQFSLQVHY